MDRVEFRKYGNYLPWEYGYFEPSGTYQKNGDTIFCYTHYFNGKSEVIESKFPIDCNAINLGKVKECNPDFNELKK